MEQWSDFLVKAPNDERLKDKGFAPKCRLPKQFKQVEELPNEDLQIVIKFIGLYLRDFKAKQVYAV